MMKRILLWILAVWECSAVSWAQAITGTWHGCLEVGGQELGIVFHLDKAEDGKPTGVMDIPQQSVTGMPVDVSLLTGDSVSLQLPAIGLSYSGRLVQGKIKGVFSQNGASFPMELAPGSIDRPNRPQEPVPPFDYQTEEVVFTNHAANARFSGTLTYPVGYTPGKRVPVVLMITGSGPQDRNEEVFAHKPFLVIADYLARHGIASLRYDDRGVGRSTGERAGCTSKEYADDAKCGLQWLKDSGRFGKTGVLGHSEGGLIAFMLGAEGDADFVVSMAGTGIKGDTLLAEQRNAALSIYGQPARWTAGAVRAEVEAQPGNRWLNYFIDYDPAATVARLKIPVMALNGSHDMQVLSASNLNAIKRLLAGKNEKNLFKEYPGLNHLFQHCSVSNALDYYQIEETCSPEVLQDIANWINGL